MKEKHSAQSMIKRLKEEKLIIAENKQIITVACDYIYTATGERVKLDNFINS